MFSWLRRLFGRFSQALTTFFDSRGGQVVTDAVEGALKTAGATTLSLLMQEAKKAVLAIESRDRDMPGPDKAASVQAQLTTFALNLGLQVSVSLLKWAIETAVQAMRSEQTEAPVVGPPGA